MDEYVVVFKKGFLEDLATTHVENYERHGFKTLDSFIRWLTAKGLYEFQVLIKNQSRETDEDE